MSNTTTRTGKFIEIIPDGSTDWIGLTELGDLIKISSIQFNPTTIGDVLIIRAGGIDNAAIFNAYANVANQALTRDYTPGKWCNPVIDASDCTFGTATDCRILIEVE